MWTTNLILTETDVDSIHLERILHIKTVCFLGLFDIVWKFEHVASYASQLAYDNTVIYIAAFSEKKFNNYYVDTYWPDLYELVLLC